MQYLMVGAFLAILAMAIGIGIGWYARDEHTKAGTPSASTDTASAEIAAVVKYIEKGHRERLSDRHILDHIYNTLRQLRTTEPGTPAE